MRVSLILAAIVAPLSIIAVVIVLSFFFPSLDSEVSSPNRLTNFFAAFLTLSQFAIPASYLYIFFVGLPVYLVTRRYESAGVWPYAAAGLIAGCVVGGAHWIFDRGLVDPFQLIWMAILILSSMTVSLTFGFLVSRKDEDAV